MANSFFKNGDKAYSENLNDGVLVGNAFDWTVEVSLPSDTGSVFPNSSTVVKAKVADVSATPNSNLSIGSTITNSSGSIQTYRLTVYPNFNRFGGFKSLSLTKNGSVTFFIANKGGTTAIVNNLDYDDLSNVPELKVLKEYDIVVEIGNGASVSGLEFVLQSKSADVSGSINQSNVKGLEERLGNIETFDSNIFDLVYPVGSIYMSVNSTSPATLFGGTWERIEERFLIGATTQSEVGDTGGEATHTLTTNEMPSHTHTQNAHSHEPSDTDLKFLASQANFKVNGTKRAFPSTHSEGHYFVYTDDVKEINEYDTTSNTTATNQNTGGGQAHNNMPPYLVVNIWKRTA